MSHQHQHGHGHDHSHVHTSNKKVLFVSFLIIASFMVVEVIGGLLTNSLALLSDAGHMLSDAFSLAIALTAFKLAEKATSQAKTFGYKRFEILAALLNGATLIVIALFIFYEAINRFQSPPEVASFGMLTISFIGLVVNIIVAVYMFKSGDTEGNLNMRGAFSHVISDMLGSIGAIIAALLIIFFGWQWADPLASVIVALLVLRSGIGITRSAVHVLMEGTPASVDLQAVRAEIEDFPEVINLHEIHVWSITSDYVALNAHIVVADTMTVAESSSLLEKIKHSLLHLGIHHMTIQVETETTCDSHDLLCKMKHEDHHHE
ncbi:cation diffusion facilitator family transporter [Lysinibacillus odysseyi]|uniref:Cation transporter n=1 Tax=Lysinibacillus odysseyi 34hs-1 = NBRC 100172 TaxID=1220589 RepID=A0A0A3IR97_9BACI|nr:cation diffusion facilitator family transporter [Lysinibacillus odysseyi]KGR85388.1 cation transporter [Lysinibacillus odysseyi 34hs-1 = NBRC 100172]